MPESGLDRFDITILILFTCLTVLLVGVKIYQESKKTPATYPFIPEPDSSQWAIACSMYSSFNTIQFIFIPVAVYNFGVVMMWELFGYIFVVWLCSGIYNFFYRLDIVSVNQYILGRFGQTTMSYALCMFLIFLLFSTPMLLVTTAEAGQHASLIPSWLSVPILSITAGIVCNKGGLKTLICLDTLQVLVLIGTLSGIIMNSVNVVDASLERYNSSDRLDLFKLDVSPATPHTTWSQMFSSLTLWLSYLTANNMSLQKVFMCKHPSDVKWTLTINFLVYCCVLTFYVAIGLYMVLRYLHCDHLEAGYVQRSNLLPAYVLNVSAGLHSMVPGLFSFTVYFVGWSNLISSYNALALTFYVDLLKGRGAFTKGNKDMIAFIVYFYVLMTILLSVSSWNFNNKLWWQNMITALTLSPIFGVILLGLFARRVDSKGALAGVTVAAVVVFTMMIFDLVKNPVSTKKPLPNDKCQQNELRTMQEIQNKYAPRVSKLLASDWYPLTSILLVVIVGYLTNLLCDCMFQSDSEEISKQCLLMNVYDDLFPFTLLKEKTTKKVTKFQSVQFNSKLRPGSVGNTPPTTSIWRHSSEINGISYLGVRNATTPDRLSPALRPKDSPTTQNPQTIRKVSDEM